LRRGSLPAALSTAAAAAYSFGGRSGGGDSESSVLVHRRVLQAPRPLLHGATSASPARCEGPQRTNLPKVCVVGDIFVDVVAKVQGLPQWDTDTEAEYVKILPGGSALNQARNLQALGAEVRFIGSLGDDSFGQMLTRHCQGQGFLMKWVKVFKDLPSSVCIVLTGAHDRGFVSCYSTTKAFGTADVEERLDALDGCTHFHVGGYFNIGGIHNAKFTDIVKRYRAKGVTFSLNTQYDSSEAWTGSNGHLQELLPHTDMLFVNESEAHMICASILGGKGSPDQLLRSYPQMTIVMTKGKDGADVLRAGQPTLHVPTKPLDQVVDATGAGDAFLAGFLSGYLANRGTGQPEDQILRAACQRGHAAAGVCVCREGACVEPVRSQDL